MDRAWQETESRKASQGPFPNIQWEKRAKRNWICRVVMQIRKCTRPFSQLTRADIVNFRFGWCSEIVTPRFRALPTKCLSSFEMKSYLSLSLYIYLSYKTCPKLAINPCVSQGTSERFWIMVPLFTDQFTRSRGPRDSELLLVQWIGFKCFPVGFSLRFWDWWLSYLKHFWVSQLRKEHRKVRKTIDLSGLGLPTWAQKSSNMSLYCHCSKRQWHLNSPG